MAVIRVQKSKNFTAMSNTHLRDPSLWLDDLRPAPQGYIHCYSVNEAIRTIEKYETTESIELIDCDHDLGDYAHDGGDGIKLLDYLLERGTLYPIRLHTMNPVGRDNMQRMIDRYWSA